MNTRLTCFAMLALAAGSADVAATELGRLDLTAPGAMISTCGGLNYSGSAYAVGDKGVWLPGLFSCNAALGGLPAPAVAQSASYNVATPEPVDATASGQATLGQIKLKAYSRATPAAGFAQAEATGGFMDVLTVNPLNASDVGKSATFSFLMQVEGTLAGQGADFSFNSGAGLGIKPYINNASLLPDGPEAAFNVSGQGQNNFPYNQTVNQSVQFTGTIVLGTSFELGVFARAIAGNASAGSVYQFNEAMVDFSNSITWQGISAVTVEGNPVAYTLGSASGIDWTQAYAPVPEPQTWALFAIGLVGMAALRGRAGRRGAGA
jgi:hypothetical protein